MHQIKLAQLESYRTSLGLPCRTLYPHFLSQAGASDRLPAPDEVRSDSRTALPEGDAAWEAASVGVLLAVLLIGGSIHQAVHLGGVCQLHLEHPPICEGVTVDLQAQEMQLSAAMSICDLQAGMTVTLVHMLQITARPLACNPQQAASSNPP